MFVYRIDRAKYARSVLTGRGAAIAGGRWNEEETPVVYCSESRALALLEILVQSHQSSLIPDDRIVVTIEIPDNSCYGVELNELPIYWDLIPQPHDSSKKLIASILRSDKYIGMTVPSVVVREERNYVLNPQHLKFRELVRVTEISALVWDERLVGAVH